MNEIAKLALQLASLDMGFYAKHATPGGQTQVHLDADEVAVYAADPVAFLAKHYGVSRDTYLAWHESNFSVLCSAKTLKGKPCKALVAGCRGLYSPKAWLAYQGEYCITHGGPSAAEIQVKRANGAN